MNRYSISIILVSLVLSAGLWAGSHHDRLEVQPELFNPPKPHTQWLEREAWKEMENDGVRDPASPPGSEESDKNENGQAR